MSRPGDSSPQRESESQTLSARTSPMKAPSWCQPPATSGSALRSVLFWAEIAARSPR